MAKQRGPQPLRLRPIATSFNSRDMPEHVPEGVWRFLLNTRTVEKGSLCRGNGWQKFLNGFVTNRDYNNEDGHDQLLSLSGYYEGVDGVDSSGVVLYPPSDPAICGPTFIPYDQPRQPYTFLAEVVSTINSRTLLRGTQSRLYEVLVAKGTQRILRDGLGGEATNYEIRLRHSQTGDFVLFTNNYDRPFSWVIGTGAHGCLMNSTEEIPELEEIGLTKSLVTFSYRGILFLCNNEEDGERKSSMARWCGADPMNWVEDPGFSLAGHYEVDFGEEILAGGVIGNFAYLLTTGGIWQITPNPDPTIVFNFTKIYTGEKGEGCIAYPFTAVFTGNSAYYMCKATDQPDSGGVYRFSPLYGDPVRDEWIHQSSDILYDELNVSRCAIHTAGYNPHTKEMYFSCALGSDVLPSVTLYCNTKFNQCSKLDFGSTAFLSCTPSDEPSLRDWLIQNCICSEADLATEEMLELGFATVKEGEGKPQTDPACESYPEYIYTDQTIVVPIEGQDPLTMEDFNQEEAGPNAVCNAFPEATLADLCLSCPGQTFFIFAHAEDWTIKQMDETFSREIFDFASFVEGSDPTYAIEGYESRLLKILQFGSSDPKTIDRVALEFDAAIELDPLSINLRTGRSIRMLDPIQASGEQNNCAIEWYDEGGRLLKCVDDDRALQWAVYRRAEVLYLDLSWSGVGGNVKFSSLEVDTMADGKHI